MGTTRLTDRYSRFLNRRMRTRMSGGVGGEGQDILFSPIPIAQHETKPGGENPLRIQVAGTSREAQGGLS